MDQGQTAVSKNSHAMAGVLTAPPAPALAQVPGSLAYMERARRVIPRGMASRGRLRAVPVTFERGEGAHLYDIDGNEYVDCVMALGPLLLGHSPQPVLERAIDQLGRGIQFGGQSVAEAELAERVVDLVPCADKVVFSNTGSESIHAAVRIARATTGRQLLVKFEGHYHGWMDPVFVNSPGVPAQEVDASGTVPTRHNVAGQRASADIRVSHWNDIAPFAALMDRVGEEVAAVLMEPIPFNFGTFWPDAGYLEEVQRICRAAGSLLIFDEIVSGFRLAPGGAQELLGVTPDMATFAKGLGSGFPIALIAGSDEAMAAAIDGPVIQGGTYNGTPQSVAAAIATLDFLAAGREEIYPRLDELGSQLASGIREAGDRAGVPLVANQIGSVIQLLWDTPVPCRSFADAAAGDAVPIAAICERMLAHGVHAAPRGLLFLSTAHDEGDVARVLSALEAALEEVIEHDGYGSGGKD